MHYALYSCDPSEMATACSSSAASGKKRKRVVLTIEDKLKICDLVKNGRSLTNLAAEFNVGKSTVYLYEHFTYPNPLGPNAFG